MGPDFRSDPMDSAEGRGVAQRAWDAYQGGVRKALGPIVRPVAVGQAIDLVGFWCVWHLHGGFDGLLKLGMPRSTIYFHVKKFRTAYGVHPDEFQFAGIALDREAYWAAGDNRPNDRKKK